jgi:hypothetical protein
MSLALVPFAITNLFRLSIAAKRMAAQNVLVKDLQGVETLGMFTPSPVTSRPTPFFFPGSVGSVTES